MDNRITLKATMRDLTGKQVKAARREGKLPAVIYGKAVEKPISIYLNAHETNLILHKVGPTKLIDIEVGEKKYPVLVKERQRNVIYGNYIHLDFLAISMTERLRAAVPIALVGDAPVVKDYNAILVNGAEEVEVECLPVDLPEVIELDISSLKMIGDALLIGDLQLPPKVTLISNPDEMVVQATAPMAEEVEEAVEAAEPDVIEKGRKVEEEE